jgi:nitroreductase
MLRVLEAGRLTGSGVNKQHWRFILVQKADSVKQLAKDSTTGSWVGNASFAVIVLTDPKLGFHRLDAGRAVQDMQLAAWNSGVASGIFTGVNDEALRRDFEIPKDLHISVVAGFGYPARKITGKRKNRKPLGEVAFLDRYGSSVDPKRLS